MVSKYTYINLPQTNRQAIFEKGRRKILNVKNVVVPRETTGLVLNFSVGPSVRLSHPWRGPLRHVCGHTYHRTTMIHAFLESPSNLDVHSRIRFSIFEMISPELASKGTLYGRALPDPKFGVPDPKILLWTPKIKPLESLGTPKNYET